MTAFLLARKHCHELSKEAVARITKEHLCVYSGYHHEEIKCWRWVWGGETTHKEAHRLCFPR